MQDKLIGFIGQGWIGKNYADDFENRGHKVIRYGLEEPYINNKEKIADCDIVFIAVPTPSTKDGFDYSIVDSAMGLIGKGKTAVIKSTILPGTTEKIQKNNPDIFVFHSPEFLTEATAKRDATNPLRNIIGHPIDNDEYKQRAQLVIDILPKAKYSKICKAIEAELIKYAGNNYLYLKVVYVNMLYDLAQKTGCEWSNIRDAIAADPRIGKSHLNPVHNSGEHGGHIGEEELMFNNLHLEKKKKVGRGAGGHCFIKDFAAFSEIYEKMVGDKHGVELLKSLKNKNLDLLINSEKDVDLLKGVYGDDILENFKNK